MTMSHSCHETKVIIGTPVLLLGGTEIHVLNLVRVLLSAGYHIKVCCYYEYDTFMVRQIEGTGAKVILMGLRRADGMLSLFNKLRKLFKQLSPDVVHVQYLAPGLIPIIAAKAARVKRVFATVHQPGHPYGLKATVLTKIAACLCNFFFCNSLSVEESWFGDSELFDPERINFKRKHFTIYNGVDSDKIERLVSEVDAHEVKRSFNIKGKMVIGVVGRLSKEKGQVTVLESMKKVIREFPDTVLVFVGDGPDGSHLRQMSETFGVSEHVVWLGEKEPEEVYQLYCTMDAVAVPSLFEGFGLAAAEAMAAGVPVIASRVDGLSEVIKHGVNGYLVSPNDIDGFAANLIDLLSDLQKGKSMGENGQKIVRERFALKRFQHSMLSAYRLFP